MSSLAFSLGYCTPIKLRTSSGRLFASNVNIVAESRIKILSHHQESSSPRPLQINENSPLFGRREAIGFGFCFSLLDVFLQVQPSVAAQTAPCELTVAPSGLAFCDKVVGTGPEAVEGQLIKVIKNSIFSVWLMEDSESNVVRENTRQGCCTRWQKINRRARFSIHQHYLSSLLHCVLLDQKNDKQQEELYTCGIDNGTSPGHGYENTN